MEAAGSKSEGSSDSMESCAELKTRAGTVSAKLMKLLKSSLVTTGLPDWT